MVTKRTFFWCTCVSASARQSRAQCCAREFCCKILFISASARQSRERFLEANKKCVTHSDLGSAACRLPAGAGVGTVAEMVVEGVEYVLAGWL